MALPPRRQFRLRESPSAPAEPVASVGLAPSPSSGGEFTENDVSPDGATGFWAEVVLLTTKDEELYRRSVPYRRLPTSPGVVKWAAAPQVYVMEADHTLVGIATYVNMRDLGIVKRVLQPFPDRRKVWAGDTVTIDRPELTLN
jgi:hypothetical protein